MNVKINTKRKRPLSKPLRFIIILMAVIALIHIFNALFWGAVVEYKHVTFRSERIPPEMSGYKIAFVSDVHYVSAAKLEEIVREINALEVDLLLLGGDFAERGCPWDSIEILSQTKAADGIFGVEGNHDDYEFLLSAKTTHNIAMLCNTGLHIRDNFFLAGVEDLWNRNANIAQAISGANPDDFILLLAHNPDVTMRQDTANIDLILSGHTHGGEITFFGVWAPALSFVSNYGHRFHSGWAKSRDGAPVFVSNGIGAHSVRVFARPQVIIITLYSIDTAS